MADEPKNEAEPAGKEEKQMSEEDIRRQIEEHFREQQVGEVLVQFLISLSTLAYVKMGLTEDSQKYQDMEQASLAIDAFKGLLEAVEKKLPDQEAQALAGALASMQITFARSSTEGLGEKSETAKQSTEDSKPAKDDPTSRLWVPGKD